MRRFGAVVVLGFLGLACAHLGSRPEKLVLAAGKYAVESIRSRAALDGVEQVIEISESGTKLTDGNGREHTLTERGALLLSDNGGCRLALAVSVDGEEPGVSDRACTWWLDGDRFILGDSTGGGTMYQVKRLGGRVMLEGMSDVDPQGNVGGDARGERIVLMERAPEYANRSADRTSEEQAAREIAERIHEL
jgi:hypothetical protein